MSSPGVPPLARLRTVRCPACGGPSLYAPENHFRPFCCERCKLHDLGAWASESFRIEAAPEQDIDAVPSSTRLQ
jgi:endogenous inhibitor of DNA gyrase (YacG/DUF329 family)